MKKIITNLRNKPDHIKSRYVILFSVVATLVIVALWITTTRLLQTSDDTIKTESPFRAFGQIFSGAVSDVKNNYDNSKSGLNKVMSEQSNPQASVIPPTQAELTAGQSTSVVPESEILREEDDTGR
jgi:hypothetical protein